MPLAQFTLEWDGDVVDFRVRFVFLVKEKKRELNLAQTNTRTNCGNGLETVWGRMKGVNGPTPPRLSRILYGLLSHYFLKWPMG